MKTPPARRKKCKCGTMYVPPENHAKACPDYRPPPQTKLHEHNSTICLDCFQIFLKGEKFGNEHPTIKPPVEIKWQEKEVIHLRDRPTFSIHLAWFLVAVLMFLAGAAWQFPFWAK